MGWWVEKSVGVGVGVGEGEGEGVGVGVVVRLIKTIDIGGLDIGGLIISPRHARTCRTINNNRDR